MMGPNSFSFRDDLTRRGRREALVGGVTVRRGSRVRLRPRRGGGLLDLAMTGRVAVVEGIDEDESGQVHLAVVLDGDPIRDKDAAHLPGHRFFFAPEELDPVAHDGREPGARVLVAGVGNVLLGDRGFGVVVARMLAERDLPAGVEVVDFGIRSMDLAYALNRPYDAVLLVDALQRGDAPGALAVIDPVLDDPVPAMLDGHAANPVAVLELARRLGPVPERVLVIGCEPTSPADWSDPEDMYNELSPQVAAAVETAVDLTAALAGHLAAGGAPEGALHGIDRVRRLRSEGD